MWASVARMVYAIPRTFVSTIARQCSGVSFRKPRVAPKPALAKTTSIRPKRSSAAAASASTWSHSVTSQATARALSGPSSAARASSASRRRAASTTRSPPATARRAVAAPIPVEPPVITTMRSAMAGEGLADPGVERVRVVERDRLGRLQATALDRPVVAGDRVQERQEHVVAQAGLAGCGVDHPHPGEDVPEQPPLLRDGDGDAGPERLGAAHVVE